MLCGPTPAAMHAILSAVSAEFGGVAQLRNPYSLSGEGRALRNHLLMLSATVLVDVGKTIGELVASPAAATIIAAFIASSDHGEPIGRWERLCSEAIGVLRDPTLASVPARMFGEVQFTLDAMKDGKKYMQLPYDIMRSTSDVELYTFFAGNDRNWDEGEAATVCLAAYRGQLGVVERLIGSGAGDPNEVDSTRNGSSAIYIAASNNHPDIVGCLLSAGADSNKSTTDNGRTPLYQAAKFGHVDVIQQLLAGGADVNQPKRSDGMTPLSMAAQSGHVAAVKTLLAGGAAVDAAKSCGSTALFLAAMHGRTRVVKELLSAGASATKQRRSMKLQHGSIHEGHGTTPYSIATENGHSDVAKLLAAAVHAGK